MADYSLPLVDTPAQLPEQYVAVTAAPSVWRSRRLKRASERAGTEWEEPRETAAASRVIGGLSAGALIRIF